ncbi:hypothetical protein [Prauserella flavalba]|uniref:Uncharacterized protein n=1 Tax=Prauserella flavalba TaxID=1477506 RepID=A0A318LEP0_9PSEU|nr:hypothetical protein [Prauserella flavalba]PXY16699.1 hypothetical protein BA062_38530 [Prauserella flavalba]
MEAEAVNVGLIDRMLERGLTDTPPQVGQPGRANRFISDTTAITDLTTRMDTAARHITIPTLLIRGRFRSRRGQGCAAGTAPAPLLFRTLFRWRCAAVGLPVRGFREGNADLSGGGCSGGWVRYRFTDGRRGVR